MTSSLLWGQRNQITQKYSFSPKVNSVISLRTQQDCCRQPQQVNKWLAFNEAYYFISYGGHHTKSRNTLSYHLKQKMAARLKECCLGERVLQTKEGEKKTSWTSSRFDWVKRPSFMTERNLTKHWKQRINTSVFIGVSLGKTTVDSYVGRESCRGRRNTTCDTLVKSILPNLPVRYRLRYSR